MTDEDYERWGADLLLHVLPKAVIVSAVTAIAIVEFSGSYGKALWVSAIALLMSLYSTWRRFLEPICAIVFVATAVAICTEPGTLAKLQALILTFAASHSQ
jgi:hypothetical protein